MKGFDPSIPRFELIWRVNDIKRLCQLPNNFKTRFYDWLSFVMFRFKFCQLTLAEILTAAEDTLSVHMKVLYSRSRIAVPLNTLIRASVMFPFLWYKNTSRFNKLFIQRILMIKRASDHLRVLISRDFFLSSRKSRMGGAS